MPYGAYQYDSLNNYMPGGLFHFVIDGSYVPTLHGLSDEYIRGLKEVSLSSGTNSMSNQAFLDSPHAYEVSLINTGSLDLRQGDRFCVQLPNNEDVDAQTEFGRTVDLQNVNNGIWGALLATRRVKCEHGGDPVEEFLQVMKQDDDEFECSQLITPYMPEALYSMLTLVANGGFHSAIPLSDRQAAANVINAEYDGGFEVNSIIGNDTVKRYLRTIMCHAMTIMESLQGFASGQVVRACNGENSRAIKPGDRFAAFVCLGRWLI